MGAANNQVSPSSITCEGLEGVHLERLLADFGQIHFEIWADAILLQAFAELKYFVCNGLWSRSWTREKQAVRTGSEEKSPVNVTVGLSPPLEMLYLIPKSPLGPPGLWLAVRMMPPTAFILRITQETAGVDMMPFCPITRWPI